MRYAEINLFGVYIAPIVPMIVIAALIVVPLRRVADRLGLFRYVWHPALFVFAIYISLLSAIVLLMPGVFV